MFPMERLSRSYLADIILAAPGWARVGLTVPNERTRLKAADALAGAILERLADPSGPDARQLVLPMEGR